MLKVFKRIVENADDFAFGVLGVIVGLAIYEVGKPYVKKFLKKK